MTGCYQHPDRPAVEQCEICRRPVCGSCLWYAETGERLCPEHAARLEREGRAVTPPGRYAAGIMSSEISAARPPNDDAPYKGNSTDVAALVAAVTMVLSLAACTGLWWALPLLAFGLGLAGWLQAQNSLNPRRTRWLSGVGLFGGGALLLAVLVFFGACLLLTFGPLIFASLLRTGPGGPVPFATPTP